ncbi:MAG: radical SAM protein [Spirochaetota bacterium]
MIDNTTNCRTDNYYFDYIDSTNTIIKLDGRTYLFHAPDLRLFRIDKLTEDVLKTFKQPPSAGTNFVSKMYPKEQVQKTLEKLKKSGVFDGETAAQQAAYKNFDNESFIAPIKSLLLNLCHTCNLKCSYCYAGYGSYQGKSVHPFMSKSVALKALDLYLDRLDQTHGIEIIDFFGGEPLLNYNVLREAVRYASKKMEERNRKIPFGITSNGLLLTKKYAQFLIRNNVKIMLSLDGDKEIHDTHRKTKNGRGSYQYIIRNVRPWLMKYPELFSARATITPDCLDLRRIYNHFKELGFKEYYVAMEYCSCEDNFLKWTDDIIKEYDRNYGIYISQVLTDVLKGERYGTTYILKDLDRLRRREKHVIPCQISREMVVVTPNGDLYPCQRLTEREEFKIGTVFNGIDEQKRRTLAPALVFEKEICKNCWARYLCGGGCPTASYLVNREDKYPDKWSCQSQMIAWKWKIWLYLELQESGFPMETLVSR